MVQYHILLVSLVVCAHCVMSSGDAIWCSMRGLLTYLVLRSSPCSPVHLNSNFSFGILHLAAYMTFGTLRAGFLPTIFFEGLSEQVKAQMVNSSERVPPLQAISHMYPYGVHKRWSSLYNSQKRVLGTTYTVAMVWYFERRILYVVCFLDLHSVSRVSLP